MVDRRGRKVRAVIGAAAIVIVVAAGGWSVSRWRAGSGTDERVDARRAALGGVVEVDELSRRRGPAQAWVGGRLLVFGGGPAKSTDWSFLNDGALVDPDTGEADRLADAPFDPPLYRPMAAATADTAFVFGEECRPTDDPEATSPECDPGTYAAATLDASGVWSAVKMPKALDKIRGDRTVGRALGASAGGEFVIGLGSFEAAEVWSFDPGREQWTKLPDLPVMALDGCVTGDYVVVLTAGFRSGEQVLAVDPKLTAGPGEMTFGYEGDGYVEPRVAVKDLRSGDGWQVSAPDPDARYSSSPPRLACTGNQAMAVSGLSPTEALARFSLDTGEVLTVADPPVYRHFNEELWTGTELVFLPIAIEVGFPGLAYNPSTDTWRELHDFPPTTTGAVWSGSAIVGYSEPIPITRGLERSELLAEPPPGLDPEAAAAMRVEIDAKIAAQALGNAPDGVYAYTVK